MSGKVKVFFKSYRAWYAPVGAVPPANTQPQIIETGWDTFSFTNIVHDGDRVIIYNDGHIEAEFSNSIFERLYVTEQPS